MTSVAILSDTHIPSRAARIPPEFRDRVREADWTIHAGDFTSLEAFETVESLADGSLTAVAGNMDPADLSLPATSTVTVEAVTFVVTHGTGSPAGYERRVARTVRARDVSCPVGVAGHTHQVLDEVVDGVRLLNPGSATGATPATRKTMLVATVDSGTVDVTVHEC